MPTITRRFEWDSGHRILLHESKCRHLHGHRYTAEITVWAPHLDGLGRVIDFGEIKRIVETWIDDNWDHNLILNCLDPLAGLGDFAKSGKSPFLVSLRGGSNPTAEILAELLYLQCRTLLPFPIKVKQVKLFETPNCSATFPDERDDENQHADSRKINK